LKSLVGIAVHKAIAEQIDSWRDGKEVSRTKAEDAALEHIWNTWSHKESRVTEIVNGISFDDLVYSRLTDSVYRRIGTFFKMFWPHISKHTYVTHEMLDSFLIPGARVLVQVDLATRDTNGEFLVSDWKTGSVYNAEEDSHQMDVYALWANKKYERTPSRIHTQVVNLRTGQVVRRNENSTSLKLVERGLIEEVRTVTETVGTGHINAQPSPEMCVSCNFLSICTEGSSCVKGIQSESACLD
jgi:hypothetical protein